MLCPTKSRLIPVNPGFPLQVVTYSDDGLTAVGRSGYFDDAVDMMAGGDMVMVSAQDGGRVLRVQSAAGQLTAEPLS